MRLGFARLYCPQPARRGAISSGGESPIGEALPIFAAEGALVCGICRSGAAARRVRYSAFQRFVAVGEGSGGADFDTGHRNLDASFPRRCRRRSSPAGWNWAMAPDRCRQRQPRLWISVVEVGQIGDSQRHQAALVATVQFADIRSDDSSDEQCVRFAGIRTLIRLLAATGYRQPPAGSQCNGRVAGRCFVGFGDRVHRCSLQGEQRHDEPGVQKPHCRSRGTRPWLSARCAVHLCA